MTISKTILGVGVFLALLCSGGGTAKATTQISGVGTTGTTSCAQSCFDQWLRNQRACASLHCTSFLFFRICDSDNYQVCMAGAQGVYELCLNDCTVSIVEPERRAQLQ